MPFINEYVPEADMQKHNMTPDSNFYRAGMTSWTVDRERDIFLMRRTGPGPEGVQSMMDWAFYWRGHLLSVALQGIANGGDESTGHAWSHMKLLGIDLMTPELEQHRSQIVDDLREALIGFRGLGIFSKWKSFDVTLDT